MISSRTYTVLARRDLEIAPTNVGASVRLETAPTARMSRSGGSCRVGTAHHSLLNQGDPIAKESLKDIEKTKTAWKVHRERELEHEQL